MEAFVTKHGDFVFRLTLEELVNWERKSIIEGELLDEGGRLSGKNLQITICSETIRPIDYHPIYKSYDRDKMIRLICSNRAFNRLKEYGELTARIFKTDIFFRVPDHPKAEVSW